MYKWSTVLVRKNADIFAQRFSKSRPAILSVVHYVEACTFVVQLQPRYIFWQLKCVWKYKQTHEYT